MTKSDILQELDSLQQTINMIRQAVVDLDVDVPRIGVEPVPVELEVSA